MYVRGMDIAHKSESPADVGSKLVGTYLVTWTIAYLLFSKISLLSFIFNLLYYL